MKDLNPQTLYWVNSGTAMILVGVESGVVLEGNPAAESLTGYSSMELAGMKRCKLHPELERTRLEEAYRIEMAEESVMEGIHVRRKDGRHVPIAIVSSGFFEASGRMLAIYAFCDMEDRARKQDNFLSQNGALAAYAGAASVLGKARSEKELLQAVCEAIARQPIHLLAWVGVSDSRTEKRVSIAAAAGSAISYLNGLALSWSEDEPGGKGPLGICIRTGTVLVMDDSEVSQIFRPWRDRARIADIRSAVAIPFMAGSGRRAALLVYSRRPRAFDTVIVELFQDLAAQIERGLNAIEVKEQRKGDPACLESSHARLTEAFAAITAALVSAVDTLGPGAELKLRRVKEIAHAIAWGNREHRTESIWIAGADTQRTRPYIVRRSTASMD